MTSYFKFLEWWLCTNPFVPVSYATVALENALVAIAIRHYPKHPKVLYAPLNKRWLEIQYT